MNSLLKKYNPNKLNKLTPEEDTQLKQEMFLALKPIDRLRLSEEIAKRIWGKKYRYKSMRGLKLVKRKLDS